MADTASTPEKQAAASLPAKPLPTPAEAMFFFAIVKHTKNKCDIDWKGVASEHGLKSAEVAKVSKQASKHPT